ncbi:MAG: hypothetical protein AAGD25_12460 [Cyanobacteria bacterium P01_F01_bin.150]
MLNLIGNWNPQFLRELKGQLKPIKILMAIALAIIGQIIFLVIMMGNLPGSISPYQLTITTYPEIYFDHNYDNPSQFEVQSLHYKIPLEHAPDQGAPIKQPVLKNGDRIIAVDGIPLSPEPLNQNAQEIFTEAIVQPFETDWQAIKTYSSSITPAARTAMQQLRKAVPNTSVTLTIQKAGVIDAEPVDISLPRIITSTRSNPYCLQPKGWDTLNQPNLYSSDSYAAPKNSNHFYPKACQVPPGQDQYKVDWPRWHQSSFWALNLATLFPLLILGGHSLISNLLKEERDGTFNFIRLSPQSAWNILAGKIMGVPGLIYGAVLLTLPLNLIHGLMGGISVSMLLSFYGTSILIAFLTFSFAVLFGLVRTGLGLIQAWLGAGVIFLVQFLCLQAVRHGEAYDTDIFAWAFLFTPFSILRSMAQPPFIDRHVNISPLFSWFGIPMVSAVVVVLLVANSVALTYWVWQALARRFFMPTSTILSKAQSYGLTLFIHLSLLGFSWQTPDVEPKRYSHWLLDHLIVFMVVQILIWIILLVALSPQQQNLQDWARFRHRVPALSPTQAANPQDQPQASRQTSLKPASLLSDFIWGEKSPVLMAIALNLLMSLGFTVLWLLHHTLSMENQNTWSWILSMLVVFTAIMMVMLIATTLVQFVFLYRKQYTIVIALALLTVVLAGPPIALAIAAIEPSSYPNLWLTIFPWGAVDAFIPNFYPSIGAIVDVVLVFGAQLVCLSAMNWFLIRQFKSIGESDTKALLEFSTAISLF